MSNAMNSDPNLNVQIIMPDQIGRGDPKGFSNINPECSFTIPNQDIVITKMALMYNVTLVDSTQKPLHDAGGRYVTTVGFAPENGLHGAFAEIALYRASTSNCLTDYPDYCKRMKQMVRMQPNKHNMVAYNAGNDLHPSFTDCSSNPQRTNLGMREEACLIPWMGMLTAGIPIDVPTCGGLSLRCRVADTVTTMNTMHASGNIKFPPSPTTSVVPELSKASIKIYNVRLAVTYFLRPNNYKPMTQCQYVDCDYTTFNAGFTAFQSQSTLLTAMNIKAVCITAENTTLQNLQSHGNLATQAFKVHDINQYFNGTRQIFTFPTARVAEALNLFDFCPDEYALTGYFSGNNLYSLKDISTGEYALFPYSITAGIPIQETVIRTDYLLDIVPSYPVNFIPRLSNQALHFIGNGESFKVRLDPESLSDEYKETLTDQKYYGYTTLNGASGTATSGQSITNFQWWFENSVTLYFNAASQIEVNQTQTPSAIPTAFQTQFAGPSSSIQWVQEMLIDGVAETNDLPGKLTYKFPLPKQGNYDSAILYFTPVPTDFTQFKKVGEWADPGVGANAFHRVGPSASLGFASIIDSVALVLPGGQELVLDNVREMKLLSSLTSDPYTSYAFSTIDGTRDTVHCSPSYDNYYRHAADNAYNNRIFPIELSMLVPYFNTLNNTAQPNYEDSDLPPGVPHEIGIPLDSIHSLFKKLYGWPFLSAENLYIKITFDLGFTGPSFVPAGTLTSPTCELHKARALQYLNFNTDDDMVGALCPSDPERLYSIVDPSSPEFTANPAKQYMVKNVRAPRLYLRRNFTLGQSQYEEQYRQSGLAIPYAYPYTQDYFASRGLGVGDGNSPDEFQSYAGIPNQIANLVIQLQGKPVFGAVIVNRVGGPSMRQPFMALGHSGTQMPTTTWSKIDKAIWGGGNESAVDVYLRPGFFTPYEQVSVYGMRGYSIPVGLSPYQPTTANTNDDPYCTLQVKADSTLIFDRTIGSTGFNILYTEHVLDTPITKRHSQVTYGAHHHLIKHYGVANLGITDDAMGDANKVLSGVLASDTIGVLSVTNPALPDAFVQMIPMFEPMTNLNRLEVDVFKNGVYPSLSSLFLNYLHGEPPPFDTASTETCLDSLVKNMDTPVVINTRLIALSAKQTVITPTMATTEDFMGGLQNLAAETDTAVPQGTLSSMTT